MQASAGAGTCIVIKNIQFRIIMYLNTMGIFYIYTIIDLQVIYIVLLYFRHRARKGK